jgi:GT2 family glycosyltransferase
VDHRPRRSGTDRGHLDRNPGGERRDLRRDLRGGGDRLLARGAQDRRGALNEPPGKPAGDAPPALDVVIVSYRSRELLRDCLQSLRRHPPQRPLRAIVVDNASDDGSAELVASDFPEVRLKRSESNLGFAAATNLGMRLGQAPYVLALNPDTRIQAGALEAVAQVLDSHPQVAVAGCRLVREDGCFDHAARRSFPTPLSALGHFSGIGRRRRAPRALAAYRAPQIEAGPVDAVNGAFMLMRRQAVESIGGFDEGYWMYMEDLDLCYRLARAGWSTWYEPSVSVVHIKAGTSGPRRSPRLNWAFHRGMFRFYRLHYAGERAWPLNLAVYVGIALKLVASLAASALARGTGRRGASR